MKRFLRKQLPAFLLVLVMLVGMMPAAAATTEEVCIEYSVATNKTLTLNRKDFAEAFEDATGDQLLYLYFTEAGKLNTYGTIVTNAYVEDDDDEEVTLKAADIEDSYSYFYYSPSDKNDKGDYDLKDMTFKPKSGVKKGTFTMEFVMVGKDDEEMDGVLEISVTSKTSSKNADLKFEVAADNSVNLSRKKFNELFKETYSGFDYLYFDGVSNLDDCGHIQAVNGDGDKVELDEDDLLDDDAYFYYDANDAYYDTEYTLADLYFVSDADTEDEVVTLDFVLVGTTADQIVEGTLAIEIGDTDDDDDSDYQIVYTLDEDDDVTVSRSDFKKLFEEEYEDLWYVEFTDIDNLDDCGYMEAEDYDEDLIELDEDDILDSIFYYSVDDVEDYDEYYLATLTFYADDDTDGEVVTLEFTMYNEDEDEMDGVLIFEIGDVEDSSTDDDDDDTDADLEYSVDPDGSVIIPRKDFKSLFEEEYDDFQYLKFTAWDNLDDCGYLVATDYDEDLAEKDLKKATFYYLADDVESSNDYELNGLTFYADEDADGEVVTLEFTLYNEDEDEVDGVLTIAIGDVNTTDIAGKGSADIIYTTTYSTSVQINANHFASLLKESYPSSSLQYVKITGVPSSGSVYYDYYNTSTYGEKVRLTSDNCSSYKFYFSPSSTKEYALTELSFIPNGFNYCPTISFTAYGSGSKSVSGEILISVTLKSIPEVYGVTPKGTAVTFPATSINSAVTTGTGAGIGSIRLLELPTSSQGTVRLTNGLPADTETLYTYSTSGNYSISSLQFTPASGFTGNVEIPYVAYNTSGNAVGSGTFSLGVVSAIPKFKDVTSSTWCYKYVAEMCDAGVISGYSDGTYRPNGSLTYGAALKLIMLAAGYEEQKPTVSGSTFSGYLTLAQKEGIVSGNVNLSGPITRLQVAQLAAKAMDLDTSDLSSVKPFTDTTDKYVQALNAAGIVEGYFSNGTSTFKPSNTLTRGHISAIVWRMENYKG